MKKMLFFVIIIFILVIVKELIYNMLFKKKKNINNNIYSRKKFMTEYERYFFDIFRELEGELNVKIHPQINLASIVNKETNNYYISELFRNIDFAIFDNNYEKLLLLIEINDNTHKTKKRIYRDKKVDSILKCADIKLIKFYSNYPNKKDYVKTRIKNELEKINII